MNYINSDNNFQLEKNQDLCNGILNSEYVRKSTQRAQAIKGKKSESLPLQREVVPAIPFPVGALGPLIEPFVKKLFSIIKSPDAVCAASALGVAAFACQPYFDVAIDDRRHPLSLFFITIAESGERKTSVDRVCLQPIRDLEASLYNTYKEEKHRYRNNFDLWKTNRANILNDFENAQESLKNQESEPEPPLLPHLLVEEPTLEGLLNIFANGQPSLGLFSDEGTAMLGGYSMSEDKLIKTAAILSKLWDGSSISQVRKTGDSFILFGKRLSTHLLLQEVFFKDKKKNEILFSQGLFARALISFPASRCGDRSYNNESFLTSVETKNFFARISELVDLTPGKSPFKMKNDGVFERNVLEPTPLSLSDEAKKEWIIFHNQLDRLCSADGELRNIRRVVSKMPEQALRIAGVFTVFENESPTKIGLQELRRAIEIVNYYISESKRIAEFAFSDPKLELAMAVLKWMKKRIEEGHPNKFSLQEIYQNAGPRGVHKRDVALEILNILMKHQQIKVIEGMDSKIWEVCS